MIQLNTEQQKALDAMMSGRNVFLTGEAGTGKSTVLREFLERCDRPCAVLAPTGVAAINVGGTTIHSFFMLKPGLLSEDTIDEIRLRSLAKGGNRERPFGGKQMIFVGDFFQLPPVVKTETETEFLKREFGGEYAFETELWEQADLRCVFLKTIHRQDRITSHPDIGKLMIVYGNQTGTEKTEGATKRLNGIGFNKFDAPTLTAIAEDYASQGWITRDQLRDVSRRIQKYHAQWEKD